MPSRQSKPSSGVVRGEGISLPHNPLEALQRPFKAASRDRGAPRYRTGQKSSPTAAHRDVYGAMTSPPSPTPGQRLGQFEELPAGMDRGRHHPIPRRHHEVRQGTRHPLQPDHPPALTKPPPLHGLGKAKRRFDLACPLPHWTTHDLRRTFATGARQPRGSAPHHRAPPCPYRRPNLRRRSYLQSSALHGQPRSRAAR